MLISKGYMLSPFLKMGYAAAETHFKKWNRLNISGIARLKPKQMYIARCPTSRMKMFLMEGLYLARWNFVRAISQMLVKKPTQNTEVFSLLCWILQMLMEWYHFPPWVFKLIFC